jgi:hypothetical protein
LSNSYGDAIRTGGFFPLFSPHHHDRKSWEFNACEPVTNCPKRKDLVLQVAKKRLVSIAPPRATPGH